MSSLARRARCFVLVLAAGLGASCAGGGGGEAAPAGYAKDVLVDTEWIEAHQADPTVRIVELGPNEEAFGRGHLPGASFLPLGRLANPEDPIASQIATGAQVSDALSELGLERDHTVVLYDRHSNRMAARAYWVLKYYRHADVRVFDGGAPKWVADGRALTTEVVGHEPSGYRAGEADPDIRTTWQYVVDHTDDPSTLLCDVRSPDEYLGRDVRADRGGHIPGAVNVEWTTAVRADGTFRPAGELSEVYARAGFTPDRQIITYCQSGLRGAHTWFVLSELLGYPDVRNYDGSWMEYGNNPESRVES